MPAPVGQPVLARARRTSPPAGPGSRPSSHRGGDGSVEVAVLGVAGARRGRPGRAVGSGGRRARPRSSVGSGVRSVGARLGGVVGGLARSLLASPVVGATGLVVGSAPLGAADPSPGDVVAARRRRRPRARPRRPAGGTEGTDVGRSERVRRARSTSSHRREGSRAARTARAQAGATSRPRPASAAAAGRTPGRRRRPRGSAPARARPRRGPSPTTRPPSSRTRRGKKCAARPRSWRTATIVRAVPLVEVDEQFHRADLVAQVEVDRRLVEDEDRRRLGHREGDEHELALAERQLAGVAPEQVPDPDALDRGGDRRLVRRPGAAERVLVRQAPEARRSPRRSPRTAGSAPAGRTPAGGDRHPVEVGERAGRRAPPARARAR